MLGSARHEEHAGRVRFHHRPPGGGIGLPEGSRLGHELLVDEAHAPRGVVDQDVDATAQRQRPLHQPLDVALHRHVGANGFDSAG